MQVAPYRRFLWLIIRICGFDMSLQEISRRRYESPAKIPSLDNIYDDEPQLLDLAKDLYEEENSRRGQLDEKVRTLLTISGILVPLTVGLMAFVDLPLIAIVPLALLLLTTVLILEFFGVDTVAFPSIDDNLLGSGRGERRKFLIKSYIESTAFNNGVNNFRVDLYRASRRLFLISLALVALVGVINVRSLRSIEKRVAEGLLSDRLFIQRLAKAMAAPVGPSGAPPENGVPKSAPDPKRTAPQVTHPRDVSTRRAEPPKVPPPPAKDDPIPKRRAPPKV